MGYLCTVLRFQWVMIAAVLLASLPPAPQASPNTALRLHRCTKVEAKDREHARCPHRHAGTHFLAREDATVNLVDSHTVRIVEPCGSANAHTVENPDPYILWFVAGAPVSASDIAQPCPAPGVSHPHPYGLPPYQAATPNPNNPDPTGAYDIVTRHWVGPTISYRVNIPAGSGVTDIFASATPPVGPLPSYTFSMFQNDIRNIMGEVSRHANVGISAVFDSTPANINWDTVVAGNPGGATLPTLVGNFIWDASCGGPTGDGVNEFIFLRAPSLIALGGGAAAAALTSTLMDVSSGQITECDVIFQTGSVAASWGLLGPQNSTAFAHEIGHFFGLDHTNLHPGGTAAMQPTGNTLIAFTNISAVPAMTGQYLVDDTAGRVGAPTNASPWKSDDIAGLASLYPVRALTQFPPKRHLINDCASITGTIVDITGVQGLYALNVFLIPMTSFGIPSLPLPGSPVVGTISGIARLGPSDVTGLQDSTLMRPTSGRFRIDGIPVSQTAGAITRYAIVVEPMPFVGIGQGSFGEWWTEGVINAAGLNAWPTYTISASAVLSDNGFPLSTGGTVQVGAIDLVPGTVINLATPIQVNAGPLFDFVSRPLVQIPLNARTVNPQGTVVTVTVLHNFGGTPLNVSAVLNGVALPMTKGIPFGGPDGVAPWTSTYNVTMPATIPVGSVFQFRATEGSGSLPTVTGMSEARY